MDEDKEKELVEKVATLTQDKENLVNEIKELRGKKAPEIDEAVIETKAKEIVERVLNEKTNEKSGEAKTIAEEKFKNKFKEFKPENDPGGIKYAAFQKTLARMNLSGLKTTEEFLETFEDAYLVLNKKSIKEGTYSNQSDFNHELGGNIKEVDADDLSPKELKLIKQQGIDKAAYLKMKEKRPAYVRELLHWIN